MKLSVRATLTALTTFIALSVSGAQVLANELTRAEVRRVDIDAGKVVLRHEHIANLDMPPMSMVFDVADRVLLANVKAGDKVTFAVEQREGRFVVTNIKPAPSP